MLLDCQYLTIFQYLAICQYLACDRVWAVFLHLTILIFLEICRYLAIVIDLRFCSITSILFWHRLKYARIVIWDYDAYLMHKEISSSNRLINHVTNLINDLTAIRVEHNASSRSLIFVIHNLSELICKKIITTSKNNSASHLKEIFIYVKKIVFMRTSRSDSWMIDWAKTLVWDLRVLKFTNRLLFSIL